MYINPYYSLSAAFGSHWSNLDPNYTLAFLVPLSTSSTN